jgi:hypothetical protein
LQENSQVSQLDAILKKIAKSNITDKDRIPPLPGYPHSRLEWALKARPVVDGRPNYIQYLPYMKQVYEDQWSYIMVVFARQMGKSTLGTTEMGCHSTTKPGSESTYVTYEDLSLSTFAHEKFRPMWDTVQLSPFTYSPIGDVGRIKLRNGSIMNMVTHAHKFKHVEGKSVNRLIFDETQYLDLDSWMAAQQTQSFTHGDMLILGIGGFVGTVYHKWWLDTDQRTFKYNDELWRDKLEFKNSGTDRLVWDDYMLDVLEGHWKITHPENSFQHGYHISQMLAPWVPLTKQDAIEKYHIHPKWSIEQQREDAVSDSDFRRHVLAEFVEGDIKPITDTMMLKLYDRTREMLEPDQVDYNLGPVFIGVDWGGGSKTIVWVCQMQGEVMVLLKAEKLETSDVDKQYEIVSGYIDSYKPKQVVVDAGGGTYQVQRLDSRYASLIRRNSYTIRPEIPLPTREESVKLRQSNRYSIDRTFSIDRIINRITRGNMVLPAADPKKVDWIVEQFCNIEAEITKLKSAGQTYRRYFHQQGRPDDALHACNYAEIAADIGKLSGSRRISDYDSEEIYSNNNSDNDNNDMNPFGL